MTWIKHEIKFILKLENLTGIHFYSADIHIAVSNKTFSFQNIIKPFFKTTLIQV